MFGFPVVQNDFPLPLSPAESDKSIDKKEEVAVKVKRTSLPNKCELFVLEYCHIQC